MHSRAEKNLNNICGPIGEQEIRAIVTSVTEFPYDVSNAIRSANEMSKN